MSSNLAFQGTGCKVQYKSSCSCSSVRHGTLGSLHNQLQFLSIRFIIINTIKIINYYYSKIYIIINIQFGGAGFLMFQWMWLCMFPAWQSLSQKSASSFFFSFSRPASPSIAASCLLQGVTLLLGVFFRVCRMSRKTSSVYGFVVTGTAKVSKSSLETASSPMSQSDFVSAVRSSLEYWDLAPSK